MEKNKRLIEILEREEYIVKEEGSMFFARLSENASHLVNGDILTDERHQFWVLGIPRDDGMVPVYSAFAGHKEPKILWDAWQHKRENRST